MGGIHGALRGSTVNGALMAGDADGFDDETAEGAYQLTVQVKALLLNDLIARRMIQCCRCPGIGHPVRVCPNSLNDTIDLQAAVAYLQLPRPPPGHGAASRPRNGIGRGAGRGTTPTRAPPTHTRCSKDFRRALRERAR